MAERPIIYLEIAAATEEDFVRAAAKQFRGDVFVAIDPPTARDIRVEARFTGGPLGVRGDAVATPTTRNGAKGVLVRMVKLAPGSVAVPIWDPAAPPTPSPMSATLAKRAPTAPVAGRALSKHVISSRPPTPTPLIEDPVEEFGAAITNTSSLSADIARTLHDAVTPPQGVVAPEPKAHAKLVRRTPIAGVPAIGAPKPVVKSIPLPPEPSIDEEWATDAPTARPAPIPKPETPKPTPAPAPISSIGARAAEPPSRGAPTFSPPRPAAALDDDAALDSAFDVLDDKDLAISVEKPVGPPPPAPPKVTRPTPPSFPVAKPSPSKGPVAAEPRSAQARGSSSPTPSAIPRTASEPKPAGPLSAKPRATSEPKPAGPLSAKPRATSEPKPVDKSPSATSGVTTSGATPSAPARVATGASMATSGAAMAREPRELGKPALPPPRATDKPTTSESKPVAPPPTAVASESAPPTIAVPTAVASTSVASVASVASPTDSPPSDAGFVPTGGFDNARLTERTPRQPQEDAIEKAPRPSEIGLNVVAASRASTEAIAGPRTRLWMIGLAVAGALVVAIVVVATRGDGSKPAVGSGSVTRNAELEKHLATAAARIQDGKLVGPDGDTALDHLLKAKKVAPRDKLVLEQLNMLATKFENLGDGAMAAGDLGEAATHFQAALSAEPERASAAKKLADVEDRARGGKR